MAVTDFPGHWLKAKSPQSNLKAPKNSVVRGDTHGQGDLC